MSSSSREEIVAVDAEMDRACELSFDALTSPERWRLLERLERVARRLPVRTQMVNDAAAVPLNDIDEAEARAADLASAADNAYRQARAGLSPRSNTVLDTVLDAMLHQQWWSRTVRELDATPLKSWSAWHNG